MSKIDDGLDWIREIDTNYIYLRAELSYIDETFYEGNPNGLKKYEGVFKIPTSDFIRITKNTELEAEEYNIVNLMGEMVLNYAYSWRHNPGVCKEFYDFADADEFGTLEGYVSFSGIK